MGRKSDSRERIVETTGDLLQRNGYHGTGLNRIIEESGAPKGSLYFHFPGGKEALACEAIQVRSRETLAGVEKLLEGSGPPAEVVRDLTDWFGEALETSGFCRGCPVATVVLEAATESEPLRATCSQALDALQGVLARGLKRRGLSRRRSEDLATLVLAAIEGGLILSRARQDLEPLRQIRRELSRLLKSAPPRTTGENR